MVKTFSLPIPSPQRLGQALPPPAPGPGTHLSAGERHWVATGLRTSPGKRWRRRRGRSSPFRASFLPLHFLGSQCPSSHMARGQGNLASGPPSSAAPSPSRQAENSSRESVTGRTVRRPPGPEPTTPAPSYPVPPPPRAPAPLSAASASAAKVSRPRWPPLWPPLRRAARRPRSMFPLLGGAAAPPPRSLPFPAEEAMAAARLLVAALGAALGERGGGGRADGRTDGRAGGRAGRGRGSRRVGPPAANRYVLGRSLRLGGEDEDRGGAEHLRVGGRPLRRVPQPRPRGPPCVAVRGGGTRGWGGGRGV